MKKRFYLLFVAALTAPMLTSCSDDDNNDELIIDPVYYPHGYALCQGSYGNNNASISALYMPWELGIDPSSDDSKLTPISNIYLKANGQNLGDQAQDLHMGANLCLYVSVTGSKYIAKLDRMGKELARYSEFTNGPRSMVEVDGDLYVSTYDGKVLRMDTATFKVKKTYEVGAYLEDIAQTKGYVAVANSDYTGYGLGHSLGLINTKTGEVTEVQCENNPSRLVAYKNDFFFTTTSYDANWNAVSKVWRLSDVGKTNRIDSITLATNLYSLKTPDILLMINQTVNYYVTPYAYSNTYLTYYDGKVETSRFLPEELDDKAIYMVQDKDDFIYIGIANYASTGEAINSSLYFYNPYSKVLELSIPDIGGVFLSKIVL